MITEINTNPSDWKKDVYIASKKEVTLDDEGNEIVIYEEPKPFKFNYQPVSTDADIAEFGENSKMMKKAVIPISYQGQFKEFDVAYLDGATPEGEENNGDNANYRLLPPRDGNSVIIIYFERLTGK
ncbi:MAG: hypothetical protein V8Q75_03280 [Bacilli bacterium]